MTTLYKNNIPYSTGNAAVVKWADEQALGSVLSASIDKIREGHWDLTVNSAVVRSFAGAPSAMTALYELFIDGGGGPAAFDSFTVTVSPVIDMTGVTISDDTVTISGHVWEDYSGQPQVVFLDDDNRELARINVSGIESVSIPANTERMLFGSSGAVPVFFSSLEIPVYVFTADRRPMFVSAYASQKMKPGPAGTANAVGETWGQNTMNYRKCPVAGSPDSAFTSTATNGPLAWSGNNHTQTDGPLDVGFERITYSFISGWSCLSEFNGQPLDGVAGRSGAPMPHYPSNAYGGLFATECQVATDDSNTPPTYISQTPYTDTGLQSGTKGDLKRCWEETVAAAKAKITAVGGTPEVICYAGYRPFYTDDTMLTLDRNTIGYSKQTDRGGWNGTAGSPGYTPTPGQTTPGRPGYSNSDAAFNDWWGYELNGLREMGFDGIGLDTGAAMWWNSAGMTGAAGTEGNTQGTPRLHDIFYSYGMAAQVEAVNWDGRGATTKPWGGADGTLDSNAGEIYEQGPCWGLAGTTVGWVGRTQDSHEILAWNGSSISPGDGTLYASVYNREGLSGAQTQPTTLGDPLLGGCAVPLVGPTGKGTEVHSVWRWNNSIILTLFQNFTWTAIKQIIWDFHNAGFIVSMGGATRSPDHDTTDIEGTTVTPKMFMDYLLSLYDGTTSERPGANPPPPPAGTPGVLASAIREYDEANPMQCLGGNGWLLANASYTTITGSGDILPVNNGTYTRLRSSGAFASMDLWCDFNFGTEAARDAFLALPEVDTSTMIVRLTVTDEFDNVLSYGESEPFAVNGTGVANPGSANLQMKIDTDEWLQGVQPSPGSGNTDWVGKPEGWKLGSGVKVELYDSST